MLLSLIGYLFCLALGAWGFYIAGASVLGGTLAASLDNLFMTLFAALMGVTAFGYLAWRFYPALSAAGAAGGAATGAARYVLPEDPEYVDSHIQTFNKIWIGLLVLTLIEVLLAYVQIAGVMVMLAILLILSLMKAGMIMAQFMHLSFDHKHLTYIVVVPAALCIVILCLYAFPDAFRLLRLRP